MNKKRNRFYLEPDEFFELVSHHIKNVDTILDIGPGIRPQNFIKPKTHICIEPHKEYLDHLYQHKELDDEVNYQFINEDWEYGIEQLQNQNIDSIFILDVIEHLEKEKAKTLLDKTCKLACEQVVIFTPLGFIDQKHEDGKDAWGLNGGKWQEHKSGWVPEDFDDSWDTFICKNFHTHDNAGIQYKEAKGAFFAVKNINKNLRQPFFSVVIPVYNHAEFLGGALDTVLKQSYRDWEAIVVNDGSTDNTNEVMEYYAAKDKRIKCFSKDNGGVSSALNEGIRNAVGKWICWLSSDDFFEPGKLQIHFDEIRKHPDKKFHISQWSLYFDDIQIKRPASLWEPIPKDEFRVLHLFHANYIHGNSIALEKTVLDDVGLFDEKLLQGQDFDLWFRILLKYSFHFIPERTCTTRLHEGQTTNTFKDGGVFDSTYSLVKNCRSISFTNLFPPGYLNNFNNARDAVIESLAITFKQNSFMHRLGYSSLLIDKINQWLTKECPKKFLAELRKRIQIISKKLAVETTVPEIKNILTSLLKPDLKNEFDLVETTIITVNKLIREGDQEKTLEMEKFLQRSFKMQYDIWEGKVEYKPKLLTGNVEKTVFKLVPSNILDWSIRPNSIKLNYLDAKLRIACPACSKVFNLKTSYEMTTSINEIKGICPECKTQVNISEDKFREFVLSKTIDNQDRKKSAGLQEATHIAYFIKDGSYLGGGSKILFKHIEWHQKLGSKVTVFSFASKPDWVEIKIDFQQINNIEEIARYQFDYIIAFSIFDIPELLKSIPKNNVFLFCQGYEGYHFGADEVTMRADKFILTDLHRLPFNTIVVSTHLKNLFKDKFNKESHYIPNGIDLTTFYKPALNFHTRENAITFIGNPFHLLKGFSFLTNTLNGIQKSKFRIPNLTLNIAFGLEKHEMDEWKKKIEEQTGAKVNLFSKLKSSGISDLLSKSKLLVCTSIYEGFSIPLLEAMAAGTPVITTSNMGAESFCIDGINSYVVNFGDYKTFAEKILAVFYNSKEFIPLVKNGFQTVKEYSEFKSVKSFVSAFNKITNTNYDVIRANNLLEKYKTDEELNQTHDENANDCEISFVIPSFNKWNYVQECVDSLIKHTYVKHEIIIIDDASTEIIPESLQSKNVTVISNNENLGFPKSINIGLRHAHGKYIFVVNNDTIAVKHSIHRMLELAESDKTIGLIGVKSNYAGGAQLIKEVPYKLVGEMHVFAEKFNIENRGKFRQYPSVSFLFTLIKKEVVEKIGELDERFSPGYFEDDDFCLRCQLAGYKTVIAEDVFVHHYGSTTFNEIFGKETDSIYRVNKQKFAEKWGGTPEEIWIEGKKLLTNEYRVENKKTITAENLVAALELLEQKEFGQALAILESLIDTLEEQDTIILNIDLPEILNLAAQASMLNNEYPRAQHYYEKILKIDPNSVTACIGLAKIFIEYNMTDEAIVMLNWIVKIQPDNSIVPGLLNSIKSSNEENGDINKLIIQSEELINENRLTEAKELLSGIIMERPNNSDALNNLSVVEILMNNYEESLHHIQQVLTLNPSDEVALANLNYVENEIHTLTLQKE